MSEEENHIPESVIQAIGQPKLRLAPKNFLQEEFANLSAPALTDVRDRSNQETSTALTPPLASPQTPGGAPVNIFVVLWH